MEGIGKGKGREVARTGEKGRGLSLSEIVNAPLHDDI